MIVRNMCMIDDDNSFFDIFFFVYFFKCAFPVDIDADESFDALYF